MLKHWELRMDDAITHIGHLLDVIHESAMHCDGGVACLLTPEPSHSRSVDFHRDSPLTVPRIVEAASFFDMHCYAEELEQRFPTSSLPNQAMISAEANLPGFTRIWNESVAQYRAEQAQRIADISAAKERDDGQEV